MRTLHIGAATVNQTPLQWQGNFHNLLAAIQQAKLKKVALLCLPELCITGYGCEDLFLSQWLPAKALDQLAALLPFTKDITVAVGLPILHQGRLYNCACLIQNTEILGFSAKRHLANDGVHYEPRWFTPWPAGKVETLKWNGKSYPFGDLIYHTLGLTISFEICEDAWHKTDRPAYSHAKSVDKIDLILNPSASHFSFGKTRIREEEIVLFASREFNCTYVYSNLLGNEAGRMIYDGDLQIAQQGKLLNKNKRLSFENVNLISTYVNFDDVSQSKVQDYQDYTSKESEFAQAAALGLFDYLRKSHSQGFVLSLSGGADSGCIAILVAEMVRIGIEELGIERFLEKIGKSALLASVKHLSTTQQCLAVMSQLLFCAYQGTKNSSEQTLESARKLAESIGAEFHAWTIDEEVTSYSSKIENVLGRALNWEKDDLAMQNIQARSRSPIIWMVANIKNALLLTTSNRSEGDVGYTTMDGDTSGSLAPIASVDKYFILQWLQWAEKELGYTGLSFVNQLQPSAELRPIERTQTDEKDLMPYAIIVEIEKLAIRDRQSPVQVFDALKTQNLEDPELLKSHIVKFFRLWSRNQWKRERIAPAFHLDDFNVDPKTWCRFPILSGGFEDELKTLLP